MQPQHQGTGELVTRAVIAMHGIIIDLRWPPCFNAFSLHFAAAKIDIV